MDHQSLSFDSMRYALINVSFLGFGALIRTEELLSNNVRPFLFFATYTVVECDDCLVRGIMNFLDILILIRTPPFPLYIKKRRIATVLFAISHNIRMEFEYHAGGIMQYVAVGNCKATTY